jgi:quinoprotein dehydrogenase-associated probable ABC transporter substrate-binding protein
MSSGSKHTVVSFAIFAAAVAFTAKAYLSRTTGPVHLVATAVHAEAPPPADPGMLRVCADPNNLPFSNDNSEGFENQIARTIAADLGKRVSYFWHPQRRGFLRETLIAGACDVVIGVPTGLGKVRVTHAYYRSSYVFVSRRDRHLAIASMDDRRLRSLRIGIPITGDDYDNPPPAQALADRKIVDNVHGYPVYGDYSKPHPSSDAVDAVRRGDVDLAIAWGPIAGFAARQPGVALALKPVREPEGQFAFDIAMAVRRQDVALAAALDDAIRRRASEIDRILNDFGVPRERK